MKRRYGYSTYVEWGIDANGETYENCVIAPAKKIDLEHDGFNYVCKRGSEGAEFFISQTIEEAIRKAHFNPAHIQFKGLTKEERGVAQSFKAALMK